MAFWKFGFAPTTNGIDALLSKLPPDSPGSAQQVPTSPESRALYESTLDALLATPDLLSEIKSASNQRLINFLAREEVVLRLAGWVVWGLGGAQEEDPPNNGILSDDIADGKVPDFLVAPLAKKKVGMGNVPRRRDYDESGALEGGDPETEQERTWAAYPPLAVEVLCSETPSLANILFDAPTASKIPHTCPSPSAFFDPFWEALLKSTELQLESRTVHVGWWARVNSIVLNSPHGQEALRHITAIPHLLPRLLSLLPVCSPLNDVLLLLARLSPPASPLRHSLIPSVLRMLDPLNSLGVAGHTAAEELMKGVIELSSAAPSVQAAPPGTAPGQPLGPGPQPPQPPPQDDGPEWKDNSLARQLADEKTIRTMLDWMLEGVDDTAPPTPSENPGTRTPTASEMSDLRTSSLIQSISVIVDLIRKNNSDFVEQQMLSWARALEAEELEREMMEAEGARPVDDPLPRHPAMETGPSLVDFRPLLNALVPRIADLQRLIKKPRSLRGPIRTAGGSVTPLTLERFRICELYAELLHCSNMGIVNRSAEETTLYNSDGFLADGWRSADRLNEILTRQNARYEEQDFDSPRPSSPPSPNPAAPDARPASDDTAEVEEDPFSDPVGDMTASSEDGLAEAASGLSLRGESRLSRSSSLERSRSESSVVEKPDRPPFVPDLNRRRPLSAGQQLKVTFMENRVFDSILELFFAYPMNNFLHNSVFDIIQQIFHGRLDRPIDRQLVISLFADARLVERLLAGQAASDEQSTLKTRRLGYMAHITLVADQVVKLFEHYPTEIYDQVQQYIPQPEWDNYVATTLHNTRELHTSPLGGSIAPVPIDMSAAAIGLGEEDDEFPMNNARTSRAFDTSSPPPESYGHAKSPSTGNSPDQFSRYLESAMSADRGDKFSSDEDDDDVEAGWGGGSRFDSTATDFGKKAKTGGDGRFAFDDDFGSGGNADASDSDDEADWGTFATTGAKAKSDAFGDEFQPTIASSTALGFDSNFSEAQFDGFGPTPGSVAVNGNGADEDDFGDFESADSPSINLPAMDAMADFDFAEESRSPPQLGSTALSITPPRPQFARTVTADDGSSIFGGMTTTFDSAKSPTSPTKSNKSFGRTSTMSPPPSPSLAADLATTLEEPLGPGVNPEARLTDDGQVETTVEGRTIRVPADEIALARRRSSIDGERPHIPVSP